MIESIPAILGILTILGVSVLMSKDRRNISWRLVLVGLTLGFVLCALILKVPGTSDAFAWIGRAINKLLDFAMDGAAFAFGDTITYGKFFQPGVAQHEFIFAIRVGFSIIFISGLASLGYYFGILQGLVKVLARFLVKAMGLSGPEALSSAAAAFVGQVECQLLIKPYMPTLTSSELFTSMTAAMATISGSALVAYTGIGMNPTYLIAASLMSALNGIVLSKIILPESNRAAINAQVDLQFEAEGSNMFDAAAHGVKQGTGIAVNVITMVAFAIGLMGLLNYTLGLGLSLLHIHAQIQDILAYPLMPVAWLLGVPWHDAFHIARLMATEFLFNEYVSYGELAKVIHGSGAYVLTAKVQLIATAALCGFANLGSLGINIGGLGAMAPTRRSEIARMAFKALLVANMATWLTAAMCGLFF